MASPANILMYHAISLEKSKNSYTVTHDDFVEHLEYLRDNNYQSVLADEYYAELVGDAKKRPDKFVLITFDDGHESDFTQALPLLQKYGFKATFFVTTDWINQPGYMSEEQILELRKAGMSVQSHSQTHRFLNELNRGDIFSELKTSKERLESILGEKVDFISFPGGRYNLDAVECADEVGYKALFTSVPHYFKRQSGVYLIGRQGIRYISDSISMEGIVRLTSFQRALARFVYHLKDVAKRLLGNKLYYVIWKKFMKE